MLLINIFFAFGNIILSFIYFIKIKSRWRYIKLWYIAANTFIFISLLSELNNIHPSIEMQFAGLAVLLSSQFAGLIVSLAKANLANKLEKEFNNSHVFE